MKIKLKLWQRVVLVTVTAIVPMACITFYVISSFINKDIDFGQQEAKGNTFQRPLETLLDLFPRYQATAIKAQAGDADAKAKLADLQQQIDKGLATLGEVYQSLGADLKFSDAELAARKYDNARLSVVQADWQNLKNAPVAVAANGETTGRLVTSVRTMITHAGNTSKLILDPDLDSYYLMDVTLCALPQTQERLSTITLQVGGWLRTGTAASKKSEVAVMAAMLNESDLGRITFDVQTALSEDKNFYGTSESLQKNLQVATEKYAATCTTFITLLQKVAAGETVDAATLENTGWAARAESFKLWETSVGELNQLLATRVASIQHTRLVSYASIAGTVLFNVLVIWLIIHRLNWILRTLTGKLSESSDQLAAASRQISRTSQGLAEGAGEQAASLQETSASLEEMASMTRRNAQTAQGARDLATQTRQTADSGMQSTGEMIKAMDGIRAASAEMHAAMNGIKAASGDVSKIIKTIDEIAFQTNILALNAAVEAARAGEAGMGFAVVADEVRNLAQRSAKAAHETAEMIETSIKRSEEGVKVNEKVQVAIDEVAGKSKQVGERLREIVARVQQMDEAASEVALASKEQSSGISQINIAVSQMDKAVQGSAASAEEAASSAEELSTQAAALQEPVADLLQLVGAQKKKAVTAIEPDPIAAPSTEQFSPTKKKPARASSQAKARQPEEEALAWAEAKPVTPAAGHKSEIPMDGDFKDF